MKTRKPMTRFFLSVPLPRAARIGLYTLALTWLGAGLASAALPFYLVKDINPGSGSSNPSVIVISGGTLYFSAYDGSTGRELWTTSGGAAGTTLVSDIYPGSTGSDPEELIDLNGALFFSATDNQYGRELWTRDTPTSPVRRVKDIFPGSGSSNPDMLLVFNNKLVFRADDDVHGKELYESDGQKANTVLISDIVTGSGGSYPQLLTPVGQYIYFRTDERLGLYGMELWRTNLTSAGTIMVDDIRPGSGGSYPNYFAVLNGKLYFRANDGDLYKKGYELWVSDSTSTQTQRLKDIWPGDSSSDPQELMTIGSIIFFNANDGTHGRELWKTDGTADGTVMVKDINPGSNGSTPHNFINLNDTLVFQANETDTSYELWKSDGSEAGTVKLHTFEKGPTPPDSFEFHQLVVANNVVFPAYDADHGSEIWRTDGTAAGTALTADILPGPGSSYAFPLYANDWTYFLSADDGTHGRELFRAAYGQNLEIDPTGKVEFLYTSGTLVSRTVTVRNSGWGKDLAFTGVKAAIGGTNASDFTLKTIPPASLAPDQSFAIVIDFQAHAADTRTANLVITTDDPDTPTATVPLVGVPIGRGMVAW